MLLAVLADTHIPTKAKDLPSSAWRVVADADLILHAGDVCETSVLDDLSVFAPTRVVMGNCDPPELRDWGAEDTVEIEVGGVRVAMIHDAGRKEGRAARLHRRFPTADVVVFGHSHLPAIERAEGQLLVNPGSPTDRRRAPHHTVVRMRVGDAGAAAELVELD